MDRLDSRTVIQTNATIIAGLLILLTLQSLSVTPLIEKAETLDERIQEKNIEISKFYITKTKLISDMSTIEDEDRKRFFQEKIDELTVEIYILEEEIQGMISLGNNWVDNTENSGIINSIMQVRLVILIMIIPFVISVVSEINPSKHEIKNEKLENSEKATKLGKRAMTIGFIFLVGGLLFIFSQVFW